LINFQYIIASIDLILSYINRLKIHKSQLIKYKNSNRVIKKTKKIWLNNKVQVMNKRRIKKICNSRKNKKSSRMKIKIWRMREKGVKNIRRIKLLRKIKETNKK
jgi:uncharacterized membrane protein